MELPNIKEKKIKFLILATIIFFAITGILFYKKYILQKNYSANELLEIKTEKQEYDRGEPITFYVKNKGKKKVWHPVLFEKCKDDFYWGLLLKGEESWDIVYRYPKCPDQETNNDFVEANMLDKNERIESSWDQEISFSDTKGVFARPGKYKIVFYYFENNPYGDGNSIGNNSMHMKNAESAEFEISKNYYDDYSKEKIWKENDEERKNDLAEIKKILESYYDEKRSYPESSGLWKLNDKSSEIFKILSGIVSEETLFDPNHPEYYYGYGSEKENFELTARFENLDDDNCELVGPSLCIYKMDSSGSISHKRYPISEVLTIKGTARSFLEPMLNEFSNNVIIITSDNMGDEESALIRESRIPESLKTLKSEEVEDAQLEKNYLVIIGNSKTNSIMKDLYKRSLVIDIFDLIDLEENNIRAAVRFAKNPWNSEKEALIVDLDYSLDKIRKYTGVVRSEKKEEFYRVTLQEDNGTNYALVNSFENGNPDSLDILEYEEKKVEIYGYGRIRNSEEFQNENSIGIIDINPVQ